MSTEAPNVPPDHDDEAVAESAEKIVSEGTDVRERVRRLVVDTVRDPELGVRRLGAIAGSTLRGAGDAVDRAVPSDPESTLRQVFDGVEDAFVTTVHAARLAIDEAQGRGRELAREDLERAADDLRDLEEMFFATVSDAATRTGQTAGRQLRDFVTHARRTGTRIGPSVRSALQAAEHHPVALAKEAAAAGVEITRQSAGFLMQAAGGLLHAAGDIVAPPPKRDQATNGDDPPAE